MAAMSIKKLGGICLVVGAIAGAVPLILSVFLGATPTEGVNIFKFFADEAVKNGITTNAYALISIIGFALVTFGIFTLRDILQNDESDNALMRLGAYLFFLGISQDFLRRVGLLCQILAIWKSKHSVRLRNKHMKVSGDVRQDKNQPVGTRRK